MRRVLAVLCFTGGLAGLSVSITGPIIVEIARHYRISEAAAGQLMTVASLSGVFGTLTISPYLDRIGRRRGITAALALMALGCAACASGPSFCLLALGYCLVGLSGFTTFAQVLAAVGDMFEDRVLGRAMGWVTFGNVGFIVLAMPIIGWLAQRWGWQSAFVPLGAGALAAAIAAHLALPDVTPSSLSQSLGYRRAFTDLRRSRSAIAILSTFGLLSASYYGFATYFAVVATEALGADTQQVSLLISVRFAGSVVLGLVAGLVLARADWRLAALACFVCGALTLVMYLAPGSVARMGIASFVYGIAVGMVDVGVNALLARVNAGSRGVVMAMRSVMDSAGGIAGPAVGGAALALGGTSEVGVLMAVMAFAAAVTLTQVQERSRPRSESPVA